MYTVLKPVNIAGKRRIIGELLDDGLVINSRVATLIRSGYLSEIKDNSDFATEVMEVKAEQRTIITIPVLRGKQLLELKLEFELVPQIFEILQLPQEDAIGRIKQIFNGDVLILIDAADNRKQIKAAAAEQAKNLMEASKEGNE